MRRGEGVLLALVLAVGLAVLLPAAPAAACSCVEPSPVSEDGLADYDAVFTGEITRNEADGDMQRRELDVTVDQVWKGEAAAEQLVVTHAQTSACGIDPQVGTEVLLLTNRPSSPVDDFAEPGELVVGSCGGERDVAEAAALGPGRPPDDAAPRPGAPGGRRRRRHRRGCRRRRRGRARLGRRRAGRRGPGGRGRHPRPPSTPRGRHLGSPP
jgi:hypothetical protein